MNQTTQRPCGSWHSPVTAATVTAGSVDYSELQLMGDTLYWVEKRPREGGRNCIVKYADGVVSDVLPADYSARSRVHEYGGGVYRVCEAGLLFVNDRDQQIYLLKDDGCCQVTHAPDKRFADLVYDPLRRRLICVCEDHAGGDEPVNTLIAVDIDTGAIDSLHAGHDFYAAPRLDLAAKRLCWLCWDHPDMPWDNTTLYRAVLDDDGSLANAAPIAGGAGTSVCQPAWSPDDRLHYVSDQTGWWTLYRYDDTPAPLTGQAGEFGEPMWVFGQSSYAFDARGIVCRRSADSIESLARIQIDHASLTEIETGFCGYTYFCGEGRDAYFVASSSDDFNRIVRLSADDRLETVVSLDAERPAANRLSSGRAIRFTSRHGDSVHAFYYPPVSPDWTPLPGEKPPLIVIGHGGPTAQAGNTLDLRKQFWTSRGFAVLDVNYSGSTGYGREYRRRLEHQWGRRDVEDVCDAALHIAAQGLADPERLIIRGSSAGGLTVLAALAFEDVFAAGACYYGISDLETLATDTHKFEARYMDRMVGPWPAEKQRYFERSPIHHVDQLDAPVIFFQGLEDRVVPPSQSERMVEALDRKGIPVSYVTFDNEQHGFRAAETIRKCLQAELWFYSRIFNFDAAGDVEEVPIRNL